MSLNIISVEQEGETYACLCNQHTLAIYVMGRYCCFFVNTMISATLLYNVFVTSAFQVQYYYQQHSHQKHHRHQVGSLLDRTENCYRPRCTKPLFVSGRKADPSIISYNRQYLIDTLGFTEEKLNSSDNILTAEIGVLDERVNWLKDRLNLKENEIKRITQQQPSILGMKSSSLELKLDYLTTRLFLDGKKSLRRLILRAPGILRKSIEDNIEPKLNYLQQSFD